MQRPSIMWEECEVKQKNQNTMNFSPGYKKKKKIQTLNNDELNKNNPQHLATWRRGIEKKNEQGFMKENKKQQQQEQPTNATSNWKMEK